MKCKKMKTRQLLLLPWLVFHFSPDPVKRLTQIYKVHRCKTK